MSINPFELKAKKTEDTFYELERACVPSLQKKTRLTLTPRQELYL